MSAQQSNKADWYARKVFISRRFASRRRVSPLSSTRRVTTNGQRSCDESSQHFKSSNSSFSFTSEQLRKSAPRSRHSNDRRQQSLGPEVATASDNHFRLSTNNKHNNSNNISSSSVGRCISRSQSADDCWRRRIPKGGGHPDDEDTARVTTSGTLVESSHERLESGNGQRRHVYRRHHRNLNLDEELRCTKTRTKEGRVHSVGGRGEAGKPTEEKQHTPGSDSAIVSDAPDGSQGWKR